MITAFVLACMGAAVGACLVVRIRLAGERREAERRAALPTYEEAMSIEPAPDHQIEAWSPVEREVFGLNDTMRWIEETDRVLNTIDWERRKAAMTPPTTSVIHGIGVRRFDSTLLQKVETLYAAGLLSKEAALERLVEAGELEVTDFYSHGDPEPVRRLYSR